MTSKTELKALTLLRSAELTRDMTNEQLKKMAAVAKEVHFAADEIIYKKGEVGKTLYLIEAGEVAIETDGLDQSRIIMNTLGPGQFFGWSSLFPMENKIAWTRATKETRAIAFDANQLWGEFQKDHYLEYAVIRRAGRDMANRIKISRKRLAELLVLPKKD